MWLRASRGQHTGNIIAIDLVTRHSLARMHRRRQDASGLRRTSAISLAFYFISRVSLRIGWLIAALFMTPTFPHSPYLLPTSPTAGFGKHTCGLMIGHALRRHSMSARLCEQQPVLAEVLSVGVGFTTICSVLLDRASGSPSRITNVFGELLTSLHHFASRLGCR